MASLSQQQQATVAKLPPKKKPYRDDDPESSSSNNHAGGVAMLVKGYEDDYLMDDDDDPLTMSSFGGRRSSLKVGGGEISHNTNNNKKRAAVVRRSKSLGSNHPYSPKKKKSPIAKIMSESPTSPLSNRYNTENGYHDGPTTNNNNKTTTTTTSSSSSSTYQSVIQALQEKPGEHLQGEEEDLEQLLQKDVWLNEDDDQVEYVRRKSYLQFVRESRQRDGYEQRKGCMQAAWICIGILLVGGALVVYSYTVEQRTGHLPGNFTFPNITDWFGDEDDDQFYGTDDDDDNNNNVEIMANSDGDDPLAEDDDDDTIFDVEGSSSLSSKEEAVASTKKKKKKHNHHRSSGYTVQYDPAAGLYSYNPFDLQHSNNNNWVLPQFHLPSYPNSDSEDEHAYWMQPSLAHGQLVAITEGDLFWSSLLVGATGDDPNTTTTTTTSSSSSSTAIRLTSTVGNVRTPMIHPEYPYLVAFTATYTGRREVYLMDLRRQTTTPTRLTFTPTPSGIGSIVGWRSTTTTTSSDEEGDGSTTTTTTLVYAKAHESVGLPDVRLFELTIMMTTEVGGRRQRRRRTAASAAASILPRPMVTTPIPLSQALDATFFPQKDDCMIFTRVGQSSKTVRYVGGTVEQLWMWCAEQERAVPLFGSDDDDDYRGTSKSPTLITVDNKTFLFFLSDRFASSADDDDGGGGGGVSWIPASMQLYVVEIPGGSEVVVDDNDDPYKILETFRDGSAALVALTNTQCNTDDFGGKAVQEYSMDPATGQVVIRVGADLFTATAEQVTQALSSLPTTSSSSNANSLTWTKLSIQAVSDFSQHQERIRKMDLLQDMTSMDAYETSFGTIHALLGLRGQAWVAPVISNVEHAMQSTPFQGAAGQNLPERRYRVVPGTMTGGIVRVLVARHVPLLAEATSTRRLALVLATDPKSDKAEHGFFLIETQSDAVPSFVGSDELPNAFMGGATNGGPTSTGGLGSVMGSSVTVSPCGRRFAWTDTDGRICVATIPLYLPPSTEPRTYVVLPTENSNGEPLSGSEAELTWSPGGRYLAIEHRAKNQMGIVSIADCGEFVPLDGSGNAKEEEETEVDDKGLHYFADIEVGRIVQATSSRFNSGDVVWGETSLDLSLAAIIPILGPVLGLDESAASVVQASTTLFYLSDRDIMTDVHSPWGSRAPSPHYKPSRSVYALPLIDASMRDVRLSNGGIYTGGGAAELYADGMLELEEAMKQMKAGAAAEAEEDEGQDSDGQEGDDRRRRLDMVPTLSPSTRKVTRFPPVSVSAVRKMASVTSTAPTTETKVPVSAFPIEVTIDFENDEVSLMDTAYRMGNIPAGQYESILSQTEDDGSLVLMEKQPDKDKGGYRLVMARPDPFPSDYIEIKPIDVGPKLLGATVSTTGDYLLLLHSPGYVKVVPNVATVISKKVKDDAKFTLYLADTDGMALSIWPTLEYQQMYNDAWRLLRDYFYDPNMNGVNWDEMHQRYHELVGRCHKREELDDVLDQMAAELSALHVFVYGGEYPQPLHKDKQLDSMHEVSSLGAVLMLSSEWKGYVVTEIAQRDPQFGIIGGKPLYSPLSHSALRLSGQKGLAVGDVIVGVNGESVMRVPDIHMLLRGMAGQSVRLDVLRLASSASVDGRRRKLSDSNEETKDDIKVKTEPIVTVPLPPNDAARLAYHSWEYETRVKAKALAEKKGFSVGYMHMQAMGTHDAEAFARGFYPDYDKDALIIDVRHNRGGNIDSWLLNVLQKRAWVYWQGRATNVMNGGLGWDEQYAFHGHLVVLIDEKTSSDSESFARGVSELGLGKLIGKRTWGGGIWLSSDNTLVDGGIATAPEIGTYNDKFGWGNGIEQQGVEPDVEVDNNPRTTFDGADEQLEAAIDYLADWLEREPVVVPMAPATKRDMSIPKVATTCSA